MLELSFYDSILFWGALILITGGSLPLLGGVFIEDLSSRLEDFFSVSGLILLILGLISGYTLIISLIIRWSPLFTLPA